jgi:hypothetical protein
MREEAKIARAIAGPTTGSLPEFRLSHPLYAIFFNLKRFYMVTFFPEIASPFVRSTPDLAVGSSNRDPVHIYRAEFS